MSEGWPFDTPEYRQAQERFAAGLTEWAEDEVLGHQLHGATLWQATARMRLGERLEALERELPVTYERELPVTRAVLVRPRLLWLHRRPRWRAWAHRRGLLDEYLKVGVSMRFERPLSLLKVTGVVS